ncbi:sugar phosphate isomerase/epimerase [Crassaminicella thermophila]|uniref:Sugar phosphate isomerase/epimerase n=1 Tax=Crassaminicella thermophila TaxID=2599308 RepID=A0A5C0SHB5_CRATE|nr:sugar phosphate isomerase/epimerase [Crassaminicella thermophila]QEK13067.1 sugar phosphate isomerase/epimerase [Crassaminicella thermophila]
MKIGLETESYHLHFQNGRMDIFDFIRKTAALGLDGVMINIIHDKNLDPDWGTLGSADPEHLEKVKNEIQRYGLFAEIDTRGVEPKKLTKVIEVAHKIGADVIRTYISCGDNLQEEIRCAPEQIKEVLSLLSKYRIKLAIENHEYETADEIIDIIKKVGSPWVGATCDTGNGMMAWEEPIDTIKKLAPYTFTTHFKDHIIIYDEGEYKVCGTAVGSGNIDTEECFKLLVENTTLTRINIEMCHPYVATFKKEKGVGGVYEVGQGAFKVEKPPIDPSFVKPSQYYYPPEEALEKMIKYQAEEVEKSVKYVLALRDKYCR